METTLPLNILPIEEDGFHLIVEAEVEGSKLRLVLDTGASRTVFDLNRLHEFVKNPLLEQRKGWSAGVGSANLVSHELPLDSMRLGDIIVSDYRVAVMDLQHVNASFEQIGLQAVEGVLGGDLLNRYQAVIDYAKQELRLSY